ncbi:MAG: hypothetical protein KJO85_05115 [Gammaproteobacteria bacterium]|nr:hypothetical protein [Gammaproteobacteria bacterium]
MTKNLIVIFLLLITPIAAHATAQRPDTILIDGESYPLNTNPLKAYMKSIAWEAPDDVLISSANWRGYLAKWEIKNGQLHLVDVTVRRRSAKTERATVRVSILNALFPDADEVVAEWYSGALIIPAGGMVHYVHMGYGSTYEKYKVLRIRNGVVAEHLNLTYTEFLDYSDDKFLVFQATEEFQNKFDELTSGSNGFSENEAMGFMRSFYAEHYLSL